MSSEQKKMQRMLHIQEIEEGINVYYNRDHKEFALIKTNKKYGKTWTRVTSVEYAIENTPYYFDLVRRELNKLEQKSI